MASGLPFSDGSIFQKPPSLASSHPPGVGMIGVKREVSDDADTKPKRTRISAACAFCRARKARCDGGQPCSHCKTTGQVECVYPPKSRKVDAEYVAELEAKAKYLEEMQGRYVASSPSSFPPNSKSFSAPSPSTTPQFASGPLPLPRQSRYAVSHPQPFGTYLPVTSSSSQANGGLGALADAAAAEHEAVPAHFASKQSPHVLPLSIAGPLDPEPSSSRPTTRDGAPSTSGSGGSRDGLALIAQAQDYPGASSTSALAGRVQTAVSHLMGAGANNQSDEMLSGQQSGVETSPYKAQDNRFIFQHSAAPEDLYVLPHRPLADRLLTIYRDHVHTILPIFHWPSLEAKYLAVWGSEAIDTDLLGTLNLIFANASLVAPEGILPPSRGYESSLRFYKRALKIMYPLVLASESIAGLQCLILMAHYLQYTPEAQLCWTTCGNCIRVAQSRGFHVSSTTENMSPIDREVRRRIWGACVQLDSSICGVLGFPSSLSPAECVAVEPMNIDDVYLTRTGGTQARDTPSMLAYFIEGNKLSAIQVEAVSKLYTSKDASTSRMPDVQTIVQLDRALAEWQAKLPPHLTLTLAGANARQGRRYLEMQAIVLTSRLLTVKMLIHRPLLFHLCARGQTDARQAQQQSPLDERIAKAGAQLCAEAAINLIEQCLGKWPETDVRLWALQLYYVHSAALVVLAARIVDENDEHRPANKVKVVDQSQTDAILTRTLEYWGQLAGEGNGQSSEVPSAISSGPARRTARRCKAMLSKISEALHIVATGRKGGGPSPANSSVHSNLGADDRYEDYARAFLELVPNSAINGLTGEQGDQNTMMGQWSMHDLLTANTLPPQPFGEPSALDAVTGYDLALPAGPHQVTWHGQSPSYWPESVVH